jgi:hypothetical protein
MRLAVRAAFLAACLALPTATAWAGGVVTVAMTAGEVPITKGSKGIASSPSTFTTAW